MQLGALLPLGDIGGNPAIVREYAQTAEGIGYDFIEAPDHVLGASEASVSEAGRNENFHNRGRRSEEQVQVMQALWAEPHVTFDGKYHKIEDAGINPLPASR